MTTRRQCIAGISATALMGGSCADVINEMKKILCLTILLLACFCVGKPVSSSIAARNAFVAGEAEEPFDNPYITDGLVAMWDAEWNGGLVVHVDVPDMIVDLVGDNHLTITGARNNFGSDFFAPNSIYGGHIRNETISVVKDAIEANDCTFEFCMTILSYSNGGTIFMTTDNSSTRLYSLGNYVLHWSQIRGSLTNLTGDDLFPAGESHTIALRIGGEYSALFIDGVCRVRPINVGTKIIEPSVEFGNNTSGYYRYHSIRLSQALTDDEIMYNYLVDKERFGL